MIAAREVTVEVTQEDIDGGAKRSCGSCPIALAINRVDGGLWRAGVESHAAYISVRGPVATEHMKAILPCEARDFIVEFDQGLHVQPFTFPLTFNPC